MTFILTKDGKLSGHVESLYIDDILIPEQGLRDCYDDVEIREISDSIKKNGLIHPIMVRKIQDHFEVVAGCRRYYACKSLGWKKIPSSIISLNDVETFELSLVENLERKSLSPLEEAKAFKKYICDKEWGSVTKLASKIGKSPSYITKRISLLNLPLDIQKKLMDSRISPSTAEELFPLGDSQKQSKVAALIVERKLPLKAVREIVKGNLPHKQESEETVGTNDIEKFDKTIQVLRNAMDKIVYFAIEEWEESSYNKEMFMQNKIIGKELLLNTCKLLNIEVEKYTKIKRKFAKGSLK
ncbi:MAG: ParB/RepB/Spo0J family partition protein [Candidatus Nitrosocosmicus sp.]